MVKFLSDAPESQKWLSQFRKEDVSTARLLLDSLTLVPISELTRTLERTLHHVIRSEKIDGPISLVSVREGIEDEESYFPLDAKDRKPKLVNNEKHLGSEAHVNNLITNLIRSDKEKFLEHSSLEDLKNRKCRSIILVEDIIGSGDRLQEFVRLYTRHPTVKSWLSYGYLRIYVVAYTGTVEGEKRVEGIGAVKKVHLARECPTFDSAFWRKEQEVAVESLCVRKSPRANMPLGYGDTKGLLAFESSVPNNTPAILWANDKKNRGWDPLFPNRAVPQELKKYFGRQPPGDKIKERLASLGQKHLSIGTWLNQADPQLKNVILVLSAVQKSRRLKAIRSMTGLELQDLATTIEVCVRHSLLYNSLRITQKGYMELKHARALKEQASKELVNNKPFYYPKFLRRT